MKLSGLQKVTLLDYPGKVAATVFFSGCNFRCPYCHNASLVTHADTAPVLPEDALCSFLDKRKGLLDGVCVSGGEPLMQADLAPFLQKLKDRGFLVKLDTNGSYPGKLRDLVERKLVDYVAMDIKNAPSHYAATTGIADTMLPNVRESVSYLLTDAVPYEFRTTVVRSLHTTEDFLEIGRWIQGASQYFLQNFADSSDVIQPGLQGVTTAEMDAFVKAVHPFVPSVQVRSR